MLQKTQLNLCSFIFLIVFIKAKNILENPYTFNQKQTLSQKLSTFQCTYGGGVINNSTIIQLGNCYEILYYIGLTLGTGTPQTFYFQFDTGSPTLWIPTGSPPSGYNSSLSPTYQITSQYNNLTYGDGSFANGYLGSDNVTVQGTPINGNNTIEWASNVSSGIFASAPDVQGLVGMDYASYPNFLDVAYQNGQISTPIFSLDLNYANQTSYLYYNNGLPQSIVQRMSWIPQQITLNGYWQTSLTSITLGSNNMSSSAVSTVIIDSGTSAVVFNQALYNDVIFSSFSTPQCFNDPNNNNLRTCYCNNTWPTFVFNFSSTMSVNMSSQYYKYPSPIGNGFCYMGIFPSNISLIILGDVFMRGYIITFDRINNRMGFYNKGNPGNGSNSGGNGSGQVFNTFDPMYFVASQYVLGILSLVLTIVGLTMWSFAKKLLEDRAWEQNLGKEMI